MLQRDSRPSELCWKAPPAAHFLVSTRQRSSRMTKKLAVLANCGCRIWRGIAKRFWDLVVVFVVVVLSWVFWNILWKTKKEGEGVFGRVSEWVRSFSVSWRGWDTSELRWITRPAANTRWNGPSTTFSEPTTLLSFSLSIQRESMEINPPCGEKKAHVRRIGRKRSSYPHFISVNSLFRIQLLLLLFSFQFLFGKFLRQGSQV